MQTGTEGVNNASYVIYVQHEIGNVAYGIDSDAPNTMYQVINDAWTADTAAMESTNPAPLAGTNDILGAGGNGAPNANWVVK
jgi:hypothetical protein